MKITNISLIIVILITSLSSPALADTLFAKNVTVHFDISAVNDKNNPWPDEVDTVGLRVLRCETPSTCTYVTDILAPFDATSWTGSIGLFFDFMQGTGPIEDFSYRVVPLAFSSPSWKWGLPNFDAGVLLGGTYMFSESDELEPAAVPAIVNTIKPERTKSRWKDILPGGFTITRDNKRHIYLKVKYIFKKSTRIERTTPMR